MFLENNLRIDNNTLVQLQSVLLFMLKDFDEFCRENNIEYWLDSGSCLGCIRHNGFIPWDDDIDIGMLRADYNRFIDCCKTNLGEKYFLQVVETDEEMPFLYAKFRLENSEYIEYSNRNLNMHKGIYLDIFPYDDVPSDKDEFEKYMSKMERISKIYLWKHSTDISLPASNMYEIVKRTIRFVIHLLLKAIPNRLLLDRARKSELKYKGMSEQVLCVYFGKEYSSFNKKDILPTTRKRFEDVHLPVPNNYELYLTSMYGDWKKYPPKEQQFGHKPWKLVLPQRLD